MQEQHIQKIEQQINNNPIMIYIKGEKEMPLCGFSKTVVDIFKILNVPFETENILEDYEFLMSLKQHTNWNTTPQVFVGGEFVGGCDITMELYKSGELKEMVDQALSKAGSAS